MIFVSASSCLCLVWRCSLLTWEELHVPSLFTDINTIAPPKSCVNTLPPEMSSRQPYFYYFLKNCLGSSLVYCCFCKWKQFSTTTSFTCTWLQRVVKITITNYVNTSTSRGQFQDKFNNYIEKQLFRGVLRKRCSENMQQIYKRTSMPKWDFNKIAFQFIEIALRHGCSLVNLLHIFRRLFQKNTFGWLLLSIWKFVKRFGTLRIYYCWKIQN